jgi:hypothetical protein
VPVKAQGGRPGGGELEQRGNDAEDAQDVDVVEDTDCREGGARRRAGTVMGRSSNFRVGTVLTGGRGGDSGSCLCILVFFFFCFQGAVWVVRDEASSASHVQKAGNRL